MATKPETDTPVFETPGRFEKLYNEYEGTKWSRVAIYGGLSMYLLWTLFPVYWMVTGSLKTREGLLTFPPQWIPLQMEISNYVVLFTQRPEFWRFILNSMIVTIATTIIATFLGACAAYGFVAFDWPYDLDFHLPFYILSTRFMPPIVVAIPIYVIFRDIALVNTLPGLILLYVMFNVPFVVWMMKGFFDEIPDSLVESAMIDGHTHLGAFFKIVLPLAKPGLFASGIFAMIITWNELLFALIITHSADAATLPVGLSSLITQYTIQWELISVAGTIAMIPVLIFAFIVRDELVRGFSMGVDG
ncbi:carbohydrate ABC transporter permease [Halostagnicola sp. A-GB9-2]|uniref:carbohydrate ABC transporter permease n=1 Tax=Halostagnicola sp. A-GB9-2 TaxID=3048066 RepID=UPI0024C011B0|nr:carbohydrate ABC transporter permease [Halostagnicola sp. A-GB9-2]MDJ1433197.1 carbohydrate ABC transporter permease [Halostagnicola sp. A-GB9-2]